MSEKKETFNINDSSQREQLQNVTEGGGEFRFEPDTTYTIWVISPEIEKETRVNDKGEEYDNFYMNISYKTPNNYEENIRARIPKSVVNVIAKNYDKCSKFSVYRTGEELNTRYNVTPLME